MYFRKITPYKNFRYEKSGQSLVVNKDYQFTTSEIGEGVFHFSVLGNSWKQMSQANLKLDAFDIGLSHGATLQLDDGGVTCKQDGVEILRSHSEDVFGVCGRKWIFNFDYSTDMRFYGLGEKNNGFEKTGIKTKFWNTDVWGDFDMNAVINGETDSMYISVPYLLIKRDQGCVGILLNNPYPVFMDIASHERIGQLQDSEEQEAPRISIGSTDGTPEFFFVMGKTVKEVTAKLQRLSGTTPLPPLWSLGNHQCRFGYESIEDMEDLDRNFDQHEIPCDGLWLDIDYMKHFKVFTYDEDKFVDRKKRFNKLFEKGRRIIPILDPGVKQEPGYEAYDDGLEKDVFCKTAEGLVYTGYVWPGRTAFPDYSIEKGRAWWRDQVAQFAKDEIYGAWLDMNDPSVGSAELDDMLFNEGTESHDSYHNQFALGMQQASKEGFLKAHPEERPFLLSRSGYTSTSQYAAVWTGDNYSNTHHLKGAIPLSLNLSLSGIPFNGPDVPGFGGDATGELAIAWHKAGFLFPFFRNHCVKGAVSQEPWAFESNVKEVVADYIRLRYKLLPYLYNVFSEQESQGHPVLRPLFYEFENAGTISLDKVDDQFLVGSDIMQAPVLNENEFSREVVLPGKKQWFDVLNNQWISGNQKIAVSTENESTPVFIREGAVIPMQEGVRKTEHNDLSKVELHVFLNKTSEVSEFEYIFDDGRSFNYQKGERSHLKGTVFVKGNRLQVNIDEWDNLYKSISFNVVAYDEFEGIDVFYSGENINSDTKDFTWSFAGSSVGCKQSEWVILN